MAHEETLYLPIKIITESPGFTFDIGGSVAKIVYRSKQDYKNGQRIDSHKDDKTGPLKLKLFARDDIDGIVEFLKKHCDISRHTDRPQVTVTGVGSNFYKHKLEEALDVHIIVGPEFDLGVDGLLYIVQKLPPEERFLPLQEQGRKDAIRCFLGFQVWIRSFKGQSRMKWNMEQDEDQSISWQPECTDDYFPCIMVTTGSLFTMSIVYADGNFESADISLFCGRFLLGLLYQLVKEKDFDKLVEMAMKGDGRTVDLSGSDMAHPLDGNDNTEQNVYTAISNDDLVIFPFGKAYNSDDVKKEDMVYSMFNTACKILAQAAQTVANLNKIKHVLFTGSFVNPPIIQQWLTRHMTERNLYAPKEQRVNFQFVRHGGYLPCIGALTSTSSY